jgi:ABC-type sugar transport system ATPase subunit
VSENDIELSTATGASRGNRAARWCSTRERDEAVRRPDRRQRRHLQRAERSIVSIIGPNGAGKTTFFNMLTGFYKPTPGRSSFERRNITGSRPDVIMKLGMARTFQNIRLFGTMTRVENVMVGQNSRMKAGCSARSSARPVAQGGEGGREKAHEELDYVGVKPRTTTGWRSTSPTATSGGWRSPARSRRTRRSCCSTSRRRA